MSARLQFVSPASVPAEGLLPQPVHYLARSAGALSELDPHSLRAHRRNFGSRPSYLSPNEGAALVDELEAAGLSGRGGAHFSVAAKWRTARAAAGRKIVVANGAEGEPLSRKDAALLELRPHLVLDGLAITAEAVRAQDAVVWLHENNHAARVAVSRALTERQGHEDDPPIRVQVGPDSYLAGESSAVASAVVGGPAIPTFRRRGRSSPADPAVLVHNVETLARIGLLTRGIEAATSTALVSVTAPFGIVVLEMEADATVGDAVRAVSGHDAFHAVLLGGYGGSWVPWHRASDLPLHEPAVRTYGLSLGAGVVRPLLRERCGLAEAATIADYLARHSARQCGPCVFGLAAIADSLRRLAECGRGGRRPRREVANLQEFVATVVGRGGCHHPDGAARMTETALRAFGADVQAHLRGGCQHRTRGSGRRG